MTATVNYHSAYCVETFPNSGEFCEVLELAIIDHGGNVLWVGKAGDEPIYRIPVKLVATKLGRTVISGDICCDYAA